MSFHIKKAEFEEAISAWKNMRRVLLEEGEKQVECINGMIRTGWEGFTAQDTADTGRKFMTDGVYAQAYDMTDKLCNIMDGAVPRMNALMKMCENLGEYLMYDEYEETVYTEIEEGTFNDGDLTINDEKLAGFNEACDMVYQNATEARDILQKMMDACDGIVDFSEAKMSLKHHTERHASVTSIGNDYDDGTHTGIDKEAKKIVTTESSYAQEYAKKYNVPCEIVDHIEMPEE